MVKHYTQENEIEATLKNNKNVFSVYDEYDEFFNMTMQEVIDWKNKNGLN